MEIEYISLDVLAARLRLPRPYLRDLARDGLIPCLKPNRRLLRFDEEAVRAALRRLAETAATAARKGATHAD